MFAVCGDTGQNVALLDDIYQGLLQMLDKLTDEQREHTKNLKPQYVTFAINYVKTNGKNLQQCAIDAGYSERSARTQATRMLKNVEIVAFIDILKQSTVKASIMSRDEMLLRLSNMARTEVADIVNILDSDEEFMNLETGETVKGQTAWSLKPLDEMTNGGMSSISELTAGKDGYKFKLHDQRAAMKQLAELLGYDAPVKQEVKIVKSLGDFYGDA